ncbi:DUF4190 domain-containing protein [Ruminococcus sp. YE282]|jgi:hypothetical protein|uniref:DUF4190 domain-containing protein n=1 Tax=Ruminococcus sp. YE282 TaxID=3158780 RepID=UPI00088ACEB3|nr:DUF4190 domain-containing protein [Ruminococcus bromii]SCX92566.1 protein of unknown function [Ruminococcus bromii]
MDGNNDYNGFDNQNPETNNNRYSENNNPNNEQGIPYYQQQNFNNQNNPYSNSQQSNYYEQQNQYSQSQQNQYGQNNYYSQQAGYQSQYNQPVGNAYQQQQYASYEQPSGKGFAIASLVLGIVSVCTCCGGLLPSVLGLIFGIISKSKQSENNGMAIAGIILSSIGIVISLIFIAMMIIGGAQGDNVNLRYYY